MKKILLTVVLFSLTLFVFAERVSLHTGDSFGLSNVDFFFPLDITFASKCTITSVKNVNNDIWCLTLSAPRSANTNAPTTFEFFIKKGETIKMRRMTNPIAECALKIVSVNWNEISFEVD